MKIPAKSPKINEVIVSNEGRSNQFQTFQPHVQKLHKRVSKRNRAKKDKQRLKQNNKKHFEFFTDENSNFKLLQSSTRCQLDSQTEKLNQCSTIQEQSPISKISPTFFLPPIQKSQQILKEINPYFHDILDNLIGRESSYVPKQMIVTDQFLEKNRNVLAHWIFQACTNFKFKSQTYFLAVNIVDRVLGRKAVMTQQLALLGITAIFMASKYEQIMTYKLKSLTAIVPKQQMVGATEILAMEIQILELLNFDFGYPSPVIFIQHLVASLSLSDSVQNKSQNIARVLICSPHWRYRSSSFIALQSIKIAVKQSSTFERQGKLRVWNQLQTFEEYLRSKPAQTYI